jgi:hypothetical protein
VVALTIVLAALNNLFPLVTTRRWSLAFGLGLIHGFGFAGALRDLGLPDDALAVALAGFNLGVETGQLAIVAAVLPLAFALRQTWLYRRLALPVGSAAVALLALVWCLERGLNSRVELTVHEDACPPPLFPNRHRRRLPPVAASARIPAHHHPEYAERRGPGPSILTPSSRSSG